MTEPSPLEIAELLNWGRSSELALSLKAGRKGLSRAITSPMIQRLGLAASGYTAHLRDDSVTLAGATEAGYLAGLDAASLAAQARKLAEARVPVLVLTEGGRVPAPWLRDLGRAGLAVVVTSLSTGEVASALEAYLAHRLAPSMRVHGGLAQVYDIGLLILGESGVGKSEAVLELVLRGHRLVADDLVELRRVGNRIVGSGPEIARHHLEIRGLGILNLLDLFGPAAVQDKSDVGLVVDLVPWRVETPIDRLGVDEGTREILGVALPSVAVPVSPGRNLGTILEVAARNQALKNMGHHSAIRFEQKVMRAIRGKGRSWKG
ncbi:MAG: HPr(Ser) kinase/phosphatase [bacterium]